MSRKALIVGSAGQDGTLLTGQLRAEGWEVLGLTRNGPVDATNPIAVERAVADFRPDEIYYLAAFHHSSEEVPPSPPQLWERAEAVHVRGLLAVLEAIRKTSPKSRLFYAASSHVFGVGDPVRHMDEETPFAPSDVYGITKVAGIHAARLYRASHGVFAACGILFNHESPLRRPEFVSQKIANGARAIRDGAAKELVLGDLSAIVDWGWAEDYVRAMRAILAQERAEDFVIASGEGHTIREFVEIAFDLFGLRWQDHVRENASLLRSDRRTLIGNPRKLRSITGFVPSMTFAKMVERLVLQD